MAILVTGGTGYIGSHTCVELLQADYELVVVDNFINSKPEVINRIKQIAGRDFVFYELDMADRQGMQKVFAENNIQAVIHFAGLKAVGESVTIPLRYYENNVGGTIALLDVMRQAGCKNMVFSSSATVYDMKNPIPYVEDYPLGCTNPYGWTKFVIEQMLRDVYTSDPQWRVSLLRYFNPIGAHESGLIGEDPQGIPNNLLPYVAQVAIGRLEQLNVYGNDYDTVDGTGVRDYVHVVDLAKGHISALEYLLTHPGIEAVNLGTGKGTSVLQVVTAFSKASNRIVKYRIAPRRPGDIDAFYADTHKAERLLGWKAEKDILEMCADSWRFTEKNPRGIE